MKILEYEFKDLIKPGWKFDKIYLGKMNLIVGQSAVGKTRFLNTIVNFGKYVIDEAKINSGYWFIKFNHENHIYEWEIEAKDHKVLNEKLIIYKQNEKHEIISRSEGIITFEGNKLPKLNANMLSVNLIKEEEIIKPVFNAFSRIYRRNFFGPDLGMQSGFAEYTPILNEELSNNPNSFSNSPINVRLFFLKENKKELYEYLVDYYKGIFPFVNKMEFKDFREISKLFNTPNFMPIMCFWEGQNNDYIPLYELSTGMQKVMLILTDITSMPEDSIYLIDEYENSLGENAINFFPEFLIQLNKNNQYLVTSHHPYLINAIPVEQWQVFNRRGQDVKILNGKDLKEKYGKSKQKAFTQLINDEFYLEGIG